MRSNQYLMFQLMFSQGTSSFALLIASPRYFSGSIQLGVLTQTASAFEQVNQALSWFIGSYTAFAEWRATVDRLTEFAAEIKRRDRGSGTRHTNEKSRAGHDRLAGRARVPTCWGAVARPRDTELQAT